MPDFWNKTPIADSMKNRTAFSFVTDITVNELSGVKGKVYRYIPTMSTYPPTLQQTEKAILECTTEIINMVPEKITGVYDLDQVTGSETLIVTEQEQVLIYEGEEKGEVYVQVSPLDKKPVASTAPYRARHYHRVGHFYRSSLTNQSGFTNNSDTDGAAYNINTGRYTSYITSARQSSINARNAAGGGTGFGK